MADICNKCGKMIIDDWNKTTEEENGELYEFHSDCFDIEEIYEHE